MKILILTSLLLLLPTLGLAEERPTDMVIQGITQTDALKMSGWSNESTLENDNPCSNLHNHGDIANMWCHMGISEVTYATLKHAGYSEAVSQAGGLVFFMVKELGDIRYDWSDINTAPITLLKDDTTEIKAAFTLEGGFLVNLNKRF